MFNPTGNAWPPLLHVPLADARMACLSSLALANSSSLSARQRGWHEIQAAPLDGEGDLPLVVQALVDILDVYADSQSCHAALLAVTGLARRADVGAAFVGALVARLASTSADSVLGKLFALRLLCRALCGGHFEAIAGSATAPLDGFGEVIFAQSRLLCACVVDARRKSLRLAAAAAMRSLFRVEAARLRYAAWLLALEAPGAEACVMAGVLLDPRVQSLTAAPDRSAWLRFYAAGVLGAPQPHSARLTDAFAPVLQTVTSDEWEGILLQPVLKALKRTPDAAATSVTALLDALGSSPVLLDATAPQLNDALQPHLLGSAAPRAQLAAAALGALCRRCSPTAALSAAAQLAKVKPTTLSGSQQRHGFATGLIELSKHVPSMGATAQEATLVVDALLPLAIKEAHEGARAALLAATGHWLPVAASSATWVSAFQKGLADKGADLRRAYLGGVLAALQQADPKLGPPPALAGALGALGEVLLTMLKPSLKKPPLGSSRVDAIAVLCCLREASAVSPAVEQQCTTAKVWTQALKAKESFVWLNDALGSAGEREVQLLFRLFEGILLRAPSLLSTCGEGGIFLLRTLMQLGAHPAGGSIRRATLDAIKAYATSMKLSENATAAERLLSALEYAAKHPLDSSVAASGSDEAADAEHRKTAASFRAPRLADVAVAALGGSLPHDALLPRLLLLGHHPALTHNGRSDGPWPRFCMGWQQSCSLLQLMRANAVPVCKLLGGESGSLSASRAASTAALAALRSVLELAGETAVPELVPEMMRALESVLESLSAVTPAEIRILQASVERASSEATPQADSAAGGAEPKAATGGGGDSDWESEVRAKLKKGDDASAKKAGKAGGKAAPAAKEDKQEAMRRQRMENERVTRERVADVESRLQRLVQLATTICLTSPAAIQPWVGQMATLLLPLPALPVLQHSGPLPHWMLPLFTALVECVGPFLRARRGLFSQTLLECVREPLAAIPSDAQLCGYLRALLTEMQSTLRAPLSPPAASLLLPVLRRALAAEARGSDAMHEVHEAAFALLCTLCEPSLRLAQVQRSQQAALLLAMMKRGDRWHEPASTALCSLAVCLEAGSVEELLQGAAFAESARVRAAAIQALRAVPVTMQHSGKDVGTAPATMALRYLLCFDEDCACAALAGDAWLEFAHGDQPSEAIEEELMVLLADDQLRVRQQVARTLAGVVAKDAARLQPLLPKLFDLYKRSVPAPPQTDARGRVLRGDSGDEVKEDRWRPRQAVALALSSLSPHLRAQVQLPLVFAFLKRALGDDHEVVAGAMVDAGRDVIEGQPQVEAMVAMLAPMLESFLAEPATTEVHDRIRQGVVLYMGALAKHIPEDDPKVAQVVTRLIEALGTPSEMVQRTIAKSLASLIGKAAIKPNAADYLAKVINTLTTSPSYAERRGAAFGISGLVKGLGIPSLKQHGVMATLQAAVENKGKGDQVSNAREGALQAYECLCEALGRLFEPYIITILPLLLACVADGSGAVRHAAVTASQQIMSQLSAQGVKMVLPSLLKALEEDKWRTKHAAVELLGSMAYCAPKQLSSTLPQVVPALTEALTHSHPRVKEGAKSALASVGAVIKNPEISLLVPTILHALGEPSTHTGKALDALAHCQFEHCVDPASMALIVPVLHRGLRERAAQAKRKTAHITGSMCSLLAERRDIVPYLPLLLPELQAVLHDPIPEVRSTGAKVRHKFTLHNT